MTHHDKENKTKGEVDAERGIKDQTDVNQGAADVMMKMPDTTAGATAEIPEKQQAALQKEGEREAAGKKKKGTPIKAAGGSTKGMSEIAKMKDQATCGFCGVSMRFGGQPTVVPVKGKKVPKDAKGQYLFKSPGAESEGTLAGVLCEMCARNAAQSPGAVDIKTVIAVYRNGNIANIPVRNIA